jgi:hypothetical protein
MFGFNQQGVHMLKRRVMKHDIRILCFGADVLIVSQNKQYLSKLLRALMMVYYTEDCRVFRLQPSSCIFKNMKEHIISETVSIIR